MNFLKVFAFGLMSLVLAAPVTAFAHGDEGRVAMEIDAAPVKAGSFEIEFELVDLKEKKVIKEENLNVVHEKKLHAFIFDPALKEFRHEHPEFINGKWLLRTDLQKNGNYFFWVQGEIASDQDEFFANSKILIVNGDQENPMPPVLGNVRDGVDGVSKIQLSNQMIRAKKMVMLTLKFSREDGSQPELSNYLGAKAHVIGVLEDGDTVIHVHPMDHGNLNELMLHASFPVAGAYRLWVQFIDGGVLKTIPLSVIAQ